MSKRKTLTSGPFHFPTIHQGEESEGLNNRLVVIITNPTNSTLEASFRIDAYNLNDPFATITLPYTETNLQTPFAEVPTQTFEPLRSTRFEFFVPEDQRQIFRITTTGQYKVEENQPIGGRLEISAVAGVGRFQASGIGLFTADAVTFFPYSDFTLVNY